MKKSDVKLHYEKSGDDIIVRAKGSFGLMLTGICDLVEEILRNATDNKAERLIWLEHIYRRIRGSLEEES